MLIQGAPLSSLPNHPIESNSFVLKKLPALKQKNTLPQYAIADFSPSLCNPHQLDPLKKKYVKTIVTYNNDGLFYTPGFLVPYFDNFGSTKKRKVYEKCKLENFNAHVGKVLKLANSKNSRRATRKLKRELIDNYEEHLDQSPHFERNLVRFDPGKQNYCAVCSKTFPDYWFHVNSLPHARAISKNKANSYIYDLCDRYRSSTKPLRSQMSLNCSKICWRSTKAFSVTSEFENIQAQVQSNMIESPKIRIKNLRPKTMMMPQKKMQLEAAEYISENQNSSPENQFSFRRQERKQPEQEKYDMLFNFNDNILADDYEAKANKEDAWGIFQISQNQQNISDSSNLFNFKAPQAN